MLEGTVMEVWLFLSSHAGTQGVCLKSGGQLAAQLRHLRAERSDAAGSVAPGASGG